MSSLFLHWNACGVLTFNRWTFPRPATPSARGATSTTPTRLPNTRPERPPCTLKVYILQEMWWNARCWWNVGKRRYDRKQKGFGGQTKPVFHKKVFLFSHLISITTTFWIISIKSHFLPPPYFFLLFPLLSLGSFIVPSPHSLFFNPHVFSCAYSYYHHPAVRLGSSLFFLSSYEWS